MRALTSIGLAVGLSLIAAPALAQGRPAGVETAAVTVREMAETITVFGQVVAERESAVATRIAGIVADVPIRVGTRVEAGEVLARLDTQRLKIEMARAMTERDIADAGAAVATVRLDRARAALDRAENLRANSTIADAQYQDRASEFAEARAAAQEAQARVELAKNAIERAQYNLDNSVVRAPFSGVVLDVRAEIGEYAASGTDVATLLDTGSMEVLANVPATFVEALSPERIVTAQSDTSDGLELSLLAILPTEFSNTRTRPVLFSFDEADATVAVGQPVTLEVPVGDAREVVVVPKDALVQARGGWSAFVNQDGTASPRTVEIGQAIGDSFEVISGLIPGDEVVVRGNERLRPGQEISTGGGGRPGGPPGAGRPGGPPATETGSAPSGPPGGAGDAPNSAEADRTSAAAPQE